MHESRRKALFVPRRSPDGRVEEASGWRRLRANNLGRYLLLGLTVVAIALLFPRSSLVEYQSEVGSIWSRDTIRAPFAFPIYKDEATYQQDVERAVAGVLPVYLPTGMSAQRLRDTLALIARSVALRDSIKPPIISDRSWTYIRSMPEQDRLDRVTRIAGAVLPGVSGAYRAGVISPSKGAIPTNRILLRRNEVYEDVVPLSSLYDSSNVADMAAQGVRGLTSEESALALELFRAVYRPTHIYSPTMTEEARVNARDSVATSQGIVPEGEIIVATGQRISEATKLKLDSYQRSRRLREEVDSNWLQVVGDLGYVAILIGLSTLYLYNFRRRIFRDNLQIGIIMTGLLLIAVMSWLSLAVRVTWPVEFLILLPLFSMLLAILFDSRTAFYHTVVACFLISGIRGNDAAIAIACLSAGVLAAYTVRDIKSRTQLFRSIAFSLLGYTLAIVALGLQRGEGISEMALQFGLAAVNAILSPVLTFGLILLVENLFGVATDLKLLEYDNLNHPLLRALADKAPGTYQHTLTIARLAESAAAAIGANALVAKVGSYFHDIGKIAKSEYFVENQMGMHNKHDRIKPEMSARIIRNHVIDGMELAREYKLPQRIIDFIPMHHGTTQIKYFLDKAREINPDVSDDEFRYPGPRPQTRETAIVMLADAVEATTRSLPNPTPKAIEETVDRAIKKRFTEGQLDQCELTLADLTKIKQAFTKNLIGMSHPRIQYKPDDADGPREETRDEKKQTDRDDPVIPYIDDAFGSTDAAFSYGRPAERKKGEGGEGER